MAKGRIVRAKLTARAVNPKANRESQLGALLSTAMINAIEECHAEGQHAPQIIKERMMAAYDAAVAEYDKAILARG